MSNIPNVSTPAWGSTASGMLIILDLDVPRENERVSLVHWLVTGVALTSNDPPPNENNTVLLTSPEPAVSYIRPNPPVGDIAHSYHFYLFQQPDNFALPSQYQDLENNRAPFNLTQFLADSGIPETGLLASNHFRVRNLSGSPDRTFPPPRATTIDLEAAPSDSAAATGTAQSAGSSASMVRNRGIWIWSLGAMGVGLVSFVL
jgi:hypothetical protein